MGLDAPDQPHSLTALLRWHLQWQSGVETWWGRYEEDEADEEEQAKD